MSQKLKSRPPGRAQVPHPPDLSGGVSNCSITAATSMGGCVSCLFSIPVIFHLTKSAPDSSTGGVCPYLARPPCGAVRAASVERGNTAGGAGQGGGWDPGHRCQGLSSHLPWFQLLMGSLVPIRAGPTVPFPQSPGQAPGPPAHLSLPGRRWGPGAVLRGCHRAETCISCQAPGPLW